LTRYDKGARSERELLNILYEEGYSVTRSAGSGVNALSPDLIALKKGSVISIECKAWEKGSLSIAPDQFEKLLEWERNSDFPTYVAWRMNGAGWFFIRTGEFEKARSNWNITKKKVLALNRKLENVILKKQTPQQEQQAQAQP
jgi:Holliday junction resolvase